jgi:hypothetical protein
MSLLATKFESAFATILDPLYPGIPVLRGHSNEDSNDLPRIILTVTSGGGNLLDDGIDQLAVELQILVSAGDSSGDPNPVKTCAAMADLARSALSLDQLATIRTAINGSGNGIGLSGLEYLGHKEGRDPERGLHGIILSYTAWAHLTA